MTTSAKSKASNPNAARLRKFHLLAGPKGANLSREDYEALLAGQGVASSKDLAWHQLDALCEALEAIVAKRREAPVEMRRLRSRVIILLTEMGIYKDTSSWPRVNDYLRNPRIAGKALFEITDIEEAKALVAKLSKLAKAAAERQDEVKRLALNN
jgi:benzoyl-CoA reductase/2-hydroxyglutaryl-CoA dehydratase subunit BcrC/BadD/HgdB